jgi:uncharacterized membrane protein (Fun14 family)
VRIVAIVIDVELTVLALEFGAGAVLGGLVGLAAKRVAKVLAVMIGVQLMLFRYLESRGILVVDWDHLSGGLFGTTRPPSTESHWLESTLSVLSLGVGFTSGFLLGFYRG